MENHLSSNDFIQLFTFPGFDLFTVYLFGGSSNSFRKDLEIVVEFLSQK